MSIPLAILNRHGLIAGATGTGKTKTLQLLAEQLSEQGVSVFAADVKGDLSGLLTPGEPGERITQRSADAGDDWQPTAYPTEFLALPGSAAGIPLRATITSFGPVPAVQDPGPGRDAGVLARLDVPLGRPRGTAAAGPQGPARARHIPHQRRGQAGTGGPRRGVHRHRGVILRTLVGLENEGGDAFFGEPEFDTADLIRTASDGGASSAAWSWPASRGTPRCSPRS